VSQYFRDADLIDTHNHARQGLLSLEEHWVVGSGWFRIATTVIGMTVTDCWKAVRFMSHKKEKIHNITIKEFADHLAYDCLNKPAGGKSRRGFQHISDDNFSIGSVDISSTRLSTGSSITNPTVLSEINAITEDHEFEKTKHVVGKSKPRLACRKCEVKVCQTDTSFECSNPSCKAYVQKKINQHGARVGRFYCKKHFQNHHIEIWKAETE